jgi:phosphatidylglycerophosphate synthase
MTRFSLEDVRRSYGTDKAWTEFSGQLFAHYVYRPISFFVTVPLLRLGVPASAVTLAGGALALALPGIAYMEAPYGFAIAAALAFVFHVLDCVDGNIARTTGTESTFGVVLDGGVDLVFTVGLYVTMGLFASREMHTFSTSAMTLAAVASIAHLLGRTFRDLLANHTGERAELDTQRPVKLGAIDVVVITLGSLDTLYPLTLLAFGALANVTALVVFAAFYAAIVALASAALSLRKARAFDRTKKAP